MTRAWIVLTAALLGGSALAQPPVVVVADASPFRVVNFADLDIGSAAGQTSLKSRIRAAARDMCLENNIDSLETALARKACYTAATSDGYQQLGHLVAARSSGSTLAAAAIVIRGR